uniref:2-C-methyl-D-erythritol 2,4-cyclodiphosphate synthase n=2 Tax=Lotharella globosa TaxID=91324 RepID=A0A7S3YVC3_9EUKA|mmetsp:Transcript_6665/g.12291  ORF Transcript_6665/g.12291 Transcript_6665/m.12291 type:complete len:231 (+) Transcript_6665:31-723(+)
MASLIVSVVLSTACVEAHGPSSLRQTLLNPKKFVIAGQTVTRNRSPYHRKPGCGAVAHTQVMRYDSVAHEVVSSRPAMRGHSRWLARATTSVDENTAAVQEPPLRIGHGWDIHRLEEDSGAPLTIGGVVIPFEKGIVAHSDGDVLYHSLTDAILGAIGMPDIGQLFPDTDPRWKGAASHVFLTESHRLMTERGYRIGNVDITLILQVCSVVSVGNDGAMMRQRSVILAWC